MKLRQYQTDAIHAVRGEYKAGSDKPILCLPTGAGKTVIASKVIERAMERGARRIVFMIDSLVLVEQTIKSFAQCGIDVGVIQGIHHKTDIAKAVQIATPQTLKRRFAGRNEDVFKNYHVDLLIVDEAHIQHSGVKEAAEHWNCPVLGLTATPYTRGLGLFYTSVIQPIKMDELIEQGYLAPYKVFSHESPDMKGVKIQAGDYVASQAAGKYDARLIGAVVDTWLKHGQGRQTLAFASTVASAQAFSKMFCEAGIRSDYTSGYLDTEDATERLSRFESGETNVLWNVQKLTKGFDMPEASCLIDCAPTRSLSLHCQKGGRILRTHPDKEFALILDHAGNYIRNGFLEDASIDFLDQGENKKDKAELKKEPRPCPKCGMIKTAQICVNCGFKTEPRGDTDTEKGDLVELKTPMAKRNRTDSWDTKIEFIGGLKHIAKEKNRKDGWVKNCYKEHYSVWPNDSRLTNARPVPPNDSVRGFITHRNIKYAYRRKRA